MHTSAWCAWAGAWVTAAMHEAGSQQSLALLAVVSHGALRAWPAVPRPRFQLLLPHGHLDQLQDQHLLQFGREVQCGPAGGCWVLGAGCWVLGAGCWVLGAGCWVLGAACWVLGAGCWVLGAACWVPCPGEHQVSCITRSAQASWRPKRPAPAPGACVGKPPPPLPHPPPRCTHSPTGQVRDWHICVRPGRLRRLRRGGRLCIACMMATAGVVTAHARRPGRCPVDGSIGDARLEQQGDIR